MTEEYKNKLEEAGIGVETALARFMGNEALFFKFLNKFPEDVCYQQIIANIQCNNTEEAFKAAHALKGVAGNLSLDRLYQVTVPIVEALRAGNMEEAKKYVEDLQEAYQLVTDTINESI